MKIKNSRRQIQGNILMVTLLVVFICTFIIGAFLNTVNQEGNLCARSQAWNQAIPASEAGIEEALALIKNDGTTWGWTNGLVSNGWGSLSNNITTLSRNLDASSSYKVSIAINSGTLKIDSIGFRSFQDSRGAITNLARKIEVVAQSTSSGPGGLICSNAIALSGNSVVDSFDSSTNAYSTGGLYDSAKARDQVTVATASRAANALQVDGSSRIWGFVNTGPGGAAVMSGVSRAGDKAYVGSSGGWPPGVEASRQSANFSFSYTDVAYTAPSMNGLSTLLTGLPTIAVSGTTYNVSDNANLGTYTSYLFSTLSMSGGGSKPFLVNHSSTNVVTGQFHVTSNGSMVIGAGANYTLYALGGFVLDGGPPTINGAANSIRIDAGANVVIYAPAGFSITASGRLSIDPTAHLTIVAGGNVVISGAGLVNTANASNLSLLGLPSCTNVTITASGNFIGTLYAPEANLTLSGASPFVGSCVVKSATIGGSGVFHYDENLNKGGSSSGFTPISWQEVRYP